MTVKEHMRANNCSHYWSCSRALTSTLARQPSCLCSKPPQGEHYNLPGLPVSTKQWCIFYVCQVCTAHCKIILPVMFCLQIAHNKKCDSERSILKIQMFAITGYAQRQVRMHSAAIFSYYLGVYADLFRIMFRSKFGGSGCRGNGRQVSPL